jgi:gliding motility-associated lipoprotein GldH
VINPNQTAPQEVEETTAANPETRNSFKHPAMRMLAICALIVGVLTGCGNENLVFEQNIEIPNAEWIVSEKAIMSFDVTDTVSQHNFLINVRNTEAYPYRNLYVFVKTQFPNGKFSRDTVGIVLADATGRWVGKGSGYLSMSQHMSNTIMYNYNKRFPLSGTYKVEIEQAMRVDTLEGIQNIGLRIEKTKNQAR